MAGDVTYEALGEILINNPNGILTFRDELIALLKTLDREEYASARGFFLTGWNGTDSYTFDRIIRGHQHIESVCISVLGSTQPGRLGAYIGRALRGGESDDGLIQRFSLLVWPEQSAAWRNPDRFPNEDLRSRVFHIFNQIAALSTAERLSTNDPHGKGAYLPFDPEASELFILWRTELEARLRSSELHPALESHLAKYRKLIPALALVNHLTDYGTGPVTATALRRAISFSCYLESHAHRAYGAGLQMEAVTAKAIVAHLRKGDIIDGFTIRDIHQHDWSNLTDRDQVKAGIDLLVDLDWLAVEEIKTGGRPKVIYRINPKALS
jgi:hypothetical protein